MATISEVQYYYLILFLLWVFSSFLLQYVFKKSNQNGSNHLRRNPPSPPALPLIGHLHLLRKDIHVCFQKLALQYGPLLYLNLGSFKFLLVSSVSMATEVFKLHDVAFSSKPASVFDDRLVFGTIGFVFSPYGDYWKYMKKLIVTELLGARQLKRSSMVRREELHRYLKKVLKKARENEVVNVKAELTKHTNNTICRMALSTRCSEEDDEAGEVMEIVFGLFELATKLAAAELAGPLRRIGYWIYGRQEMEITRKGDELLEKIWKEHEERAKQEGVDREDKDLMDILLEAYHDEKAEFKITKKHVKACILDLFIAGTSTSTETMQWVMANLINHPEVMNKVREEIDLAVGNKRLVEETDLPNLPYLQAVVKETLRLYPAGPLVPRKTYKACKVSGFDIPEDIMVFFNYYAIMRDPEAWDNPNEFIPDRFLSSSKEETNHHIINFVAFGAGRRMCPGATLALTLMNTTIASMVQCFDWKVGMDGDRVVNMEPEVGLHLALAEPLQCRPIVRFNPFSC